MKDDPQQADPELIAALLAAGLSQTTAERLAHDKPVECRRQLAALPAVAATTSNPAAYLRAAIEQGWVLPHNARRQR